MKHLVLAAMTVASLSLVVPGPASGVPSAADTGDRAIATESPFMLGKTQYRKLLGATPGRTTVSGFRNCTTLEVRVEGYRPVPGCAAKKSATSIRGVSISAWVRAANPLVAEVTKRFNQYKAFATRGQTLFRGGYVEYNISIDSRRTIPGGYVVTAKQVEGAQVPDEMQPYAVAAVLDPRLKRSGLFVTAECRAPEDYINSFAPNTFQVLRNCAAAVALGQAAWLKGREGTFRQAASPISWYNNAEE